MNDDNSIPDVDIYRGGSPISRPFSPVTSSSSSSSSFAGGRLGAITTVVELAISRWARQWTRGTASDSSSSSSRSSVITLSLPQRLRIRRRRSVATVQSEQSERDIAVRISLLKAREESRQVPRNFTLYLPPSLSSSRDAAPHTTLTTSLPLLLQQLDIAVKKATKAHRNHARQHLTTGKNHAKRPIRHQDYMLPSPAVPSFIPRSTKPKAWYLDVASPTWEDMRTLGKANSPSHNRTKVKNGLEVLDSSAPDAGIIGEANVYLVVFKEGICSVRHWIAHGILDSIVDSFFPLLEEIELEVAAIEDLVLTAGGTPCVGPRQYDAQPAPMRTLYEPERESILLPDAEKYSTNIFIPSIDNFAHFPTNQASGQRTLAKVVGKHSLSLKPNPNHFTTYGKDQEIDYVPESPAGDQVRGRCTDPKTPLDREWA
ncbi:hypothetical protein C0995_008787 [Termitomyces sp. Mi166|nr:hypothetical protein C0995_008787 [Termitomyces sp. Mi166\